MTTAAPEKLAEASEMVQNAFSTARDFARDKLPQVKEGYEDGIGWLKSYLPESLAPYADELVAGTLGVGFSLATGGGLPSAIMLGSLALAAKSALIDGDYKMAASYATGGLAASSLASGDIGTAAIAGAATYAVNKFWPQISDGAQQVASLLPTPALQQ
ncbi:MAG: hypothetical protein R3D88_02665 [Alphaproteobacteria bacterium]|nr:hypothetical protein [Alphaproteobacteria bacterium]